MKDDDNRGKNAASESGGNGESVGGNVAKGNPIEDGY